MLREDAIAVISASLSRGSIAPAAGAANPDAYLATQGARLLEVVVEPTVVTISRSTFDYGLLEQLQGETLFAIAREADTWLIYCTPSKRFLQAFGGSVNDLTALGFASEDALCEWLG